MANTNLFLMFFLASLISLSDSQESFCSEDDKIVNCVPCTTISNLKRFHCPQQCNSKAQSICTEVCSKFCLNNPCKYESEILECSEGCIGGLTGKYCHEACPGNCARCNQFTGDCLPDEKKISKTEQRTTKVKDKHIVKVTKTSLSGKTFVRDAATYLSRGITTDVDYSRTSPGATVEGKSQNSGMRFLLPGIQLTVIVACAITTITLIFVWRKMLKQKLLNV